MLIRRTIEDCVSDARKLMLQELDVVPGSDVDDVVDARAVLDVNRCLLIVFQKTQAVLSAGFP